MNEILDLVKAMNNLPKSKENLHAVIIENKDNNYDELVEWCEQNCKHPWKGLINEGQDYGWYNKQWQHMPNYTFLFKHDDDALMFKLICKK